MGFRSTGTLKTGAAFWIQWIIRTALNETTYNSSLNVDKGSKTAGYTRPPSPTLRQFVLLQIRTAGLLFPNLISTGFPGKDIPLWIHLSLFPPSFSLSPPTPPFPPVQPRDSSYSGEYGGGGGEWFSQSGNQLDGPITAIRLRVSNYYIVG